jgi:hypothetical protein
MIGDDRRYQRRGKGVEWLEYLGTFLITSLTILAHFSQRKSLSVDPLLLL